MQRSIRILSGNNEMEQIPSLRHLLQLLCKSPLSPSARIFICYPDPYLLLATLVPSLPSPQRTLHLSSRDSYTILQAVSLEEPPSPNPLLECLSWVKCYVRRENMIARRVLIHPLLTISALRLYLHRIYQTPPMRIVINGTDRAEEHQILYPLIQEGSIINVVLQWDSSLRTVLWKEPKGQQVFSADVTECKNIQQIKEVICRDGEFKTNQIALSYAGEILKQHKRINEYFLSEKGIVYVLRAQKYLKKGQPPQRHLQSVNLNRIKKEGTQKIDQQQQKEVRREQENVKQQQIKMQMSDELVSSNIKSNTASKENRFILKQSSPSSMLAESIHLSGSPYVSLQSPYVSLLSSQMEPCFVSNSNFFVASSMNHNESEVGQSKSIYEVGGQSKSKYEEGEQSKSKYEEGEESKSKYKTGQLNEIGSNYLCNSISQEIPSSGTTLTLAESHFMMEGQPEAKEEVSQSSHVEIIIRGPDREDAKKIALMDIVDQMITDIAKQNNLNKDQIQLYLRDRKLQEYEMVADLFVDGDIVDMRILSA